MEKLGIEPVLLLTQIINFTILVVILTKFLYRPILKMLDDRKKKIEDGLLMAEKMKTKEEELDTAREKVLDHAKAEGREIIEEAKNRAKKLEEAILIRANDEAKTIKEKAKVEAMEEKEVIMGELNNKVLSIAMAIVKTILPGILDKKAHMDLIEKKIATLEKENNHGVKK